MINSDNGKLSEVGDIGEFVNTSTDDVPAPYPDLTESTGRFPFYRRLYLIISCRFSESANGQMLSGELPGTRE